MAVRIRVSIERAGAWKGDRPAEIRTVALANSGYEAGKSDLSLPIAAANLLGLWPPPPEAHREVVQAYGGLLEIAALPDAVRVRVLTSDRDGPVVNAGVLFTQTDNEVVLSDWLVGALAIVLLEPGIGAWCFRDELGQRNRASEAPVIW
ncbi:MAG: hypothetical protein HY720_10205 [Planctomycetes bacterium]|nr:hypothetical protein [Planctomycetota bacterium]